MARDLLDLHGCRAEDVEERVDRFLAQAVQGNLRKIKIMTGKGTGVVRKIVIDYLKLGNYPWSFEKLANGKPNEGVLVIHLD